MVAEELTMGMRLDQVWPNVPWFVQVVVLDERRCFIVAVSSSECFDLLF